MKRRLYSILCMLAATVIYALAVLQPWEYRYTIIWNDFHGNLSVERDTWLNWYYRGFSTQPPLTEEAIERKARELREDKDFAKFADTYFEKNSQLPLPQHTDLSENFEREARIEQNKDLSDALEKEARIKTYQHTIEMLLN